MYRVVLNGKAIYRIVSRKEREDSHVLGIWTRSMVASAIVVPG